MRIMSYQNHLFYNEDIYVGVLMRTLPLLYSDNDLEIIIRCRILFLHFCPMRVFFLINKRYEE